MGKMLFCRTGWMKFYQGTSSDDPISGGGSFVEDHRYGHEIYNFLPDDKGNIYGFVEVGKGKDMALFRLDAPWLAMSASGVLVIWCAKSPTVGETFIVGWYRDATVFRCSQPCPDHLVEKRPLPDSTDNWTYRIAAKAVNATLLSEDDRDFIIPKATTSRAGIGQKNFWYADSGRDLEIRRQVEKYLLNRDKVISKQKVPKIPRHEQDIEKRQKVELAAMKAVESWYQDQGWVTKDVSDAKLGWDIEARRDKLTLKIEVKGLSGDTIAVELTPKEYDQMKSLPQSDYRLCIVTNALDSKPSIYHFDYDKKSRKLVEVDSKAELLIQERIGAIITGT